MIPVQALFEIFTACEKFRHERRFGDAVDEAERVVALASQYFDIVDFAVEPMTRNVLATLRGALNQCDDREMRRHITAGIRRGTVMLADQIVEDPKLVRPPPPAPLLAAAADADTEVLPAPETRSEGR